MARESALVFNPHVNIVAHHGNIKSHEFGPDYFKKFTLVMNALDNLGMPLSTFCLFFFCSFLPYIIHKFLFLFYCFYVSPPPSFNKLHETTTKVDKPNWEQIQVFIYFKNKVS